MAEPKVFFVHLRRPDKKNPKEQRDDPFYEFGSFGCTGCHSRNLLHPRRAAELQGARLAFVQGGRFGSRLVFLTPPITVTVWRDRCEARWTPREVPFKYTEAPILAYNEGWTDFRLVEQFARAATGCPTAESGLSSRLRSRVRPLSGDMAKHVIAIYKRRWAAAPSYAFASTYDEALPYAPPRIDRDRKATYARFISELDGDSDGAENVSHFEALQPKTQGQSRCGVSRRRQSRRRKRRCI